MKNSLKLLVVFLFLTVKVTYAQTGIGTTSPNPAAVLDVSSTSKGLLPPRMTTTQRDVISNPVAGLVIYNTDKNCLEWYNGVYWYNSCGEIVSLSVLVQIGNEGDSPNVIPSVVTVAQINTVVPGVTGALLANQSAYQAYIDANPSLFNAPATQDQVQAMINAVNSAQVISQSVLAQIGNEGDSPNVVPSVVTVAQINTIVPVVMGAIFVNQSAYQAYIDANPSLFDALATQAQVQAMVTAVNTLLSSGGTALVSSYSCSTASAGIMTSGAAVSGVTQTITATVTSVGTYSISTTANGVTFAASGTFAGTGAQNIVLTATGTPTADGTNTFTLNTTPNCNFSRITNNLLPGNITLLAVSPYFVASVYDQDYLPYTTPIGPVSLVTSQAANGINEAITLNIQGTLTTSGVTIKIPYTVVTASVNLPAFIQTITIPASYTQDNISQEVTFSYNAATLAVGSGFINATLKTVGGTLNIKKLDVQTGIGSDNLGWLLGEFTYYTNNSGGITNFQFRSIAGIPDRNVIDANHVMLYLPVRGADGKVWLNNNLGADYSNTSKAVFNPAQQATSITDYKSYGSLFQWGRYSDGHELINWTSGTVGAPVNATTTTTLATTNTPGNALFISSATTPYDWRNPGNDNLWQGEAGINNPCPVGYRLPTKAEFSAFMTASIIYDKFQAYNSVLKITVPVYRENGGYFTPAGYGAYWISTVASTSAYMYTCSDINSSITSFVRSFAMSVRCIKH